MTPERGYQVRRVLADVLEAAPADRIALLNTACATDPELRREIDDALGGGALLANFVALPQTSVLPILLRADADGQPGQVPPRLQPGTRIGPYKVVRLLGRGGMGEVYLAQDTRLYRLVALKCVARRIADQPTARVRLLHEARSAARLTHPNIASVHDVLDCEDGSIVVVMEYVEGRSLAARLAQASYSVAEAVDLAVTVAIALEHAHAAGIVHCDIKPGNIQLMNGGSLKILDFGVARSLVHPADATTSTSTLNAPALGGTPGYMSPEQTLGLPVDARTDVFSLGVVLFEMLTRERPFGSGRRWLEPIHAVLADAPSLDRLPASVPPQLAGVIAKALRHEPGARYQDAGEFRKALEETRGGYLPVERGGRPPYGRRPTGIALALSVLVVMLAGVAWRVSHRGPVTRISPAAERWYVDGVHALQEGAYLQATRALGRAVQIDGSYALSWARLGEAQLELDQEPAARQSLLKASSLVPDRSRLPAQQRLFLEAAMAMASRDNATALRAYSDLARTTPPSAPLLIDLGRVHEAMSAPAKAVESYQRATELDSQNPAPFLRLAIIQGRSQNPAAAEAAFARAEELYRARGRTEGEAAVAYERGVMLDRFDRTADAIAVLQKARQLAESVDSQYLRAAVAFKMSAVEGRGGNYRDAEELAWEARALSEPFAALHAFGLVDVGNVSIYMGRPELAEETFREAVGKAVRAGAPRAEARARLALAGLLAGGPRAREAIPHATAALQYYRLTGFVAQQLRAQTFLIVAQERTGDLAGAQSSYEDTLREATRAGNESAIAEQHYLLSGVLLQRERYPSALMHCDESLRRYRALKLPYDVVHSTGRRIDILWRMGRFDDARKELSATAAAGSGRNSPGMPADPSRSVRWAFIALAEGTPSRAAKLAGGALAVESEELTPALKSELQVVLALALARSGRAEDAWRHVEAAGTPDASAGPSDVALARAEVLVRLRRFDEALAAAAMLAERFAARGRHESAWLAARHAARSAAELRRVSDAARWRSFADSQWAHQSAQFDAETLRNYAKRADLTMF